MGWGRAGGALGALGGSFLLWAGLLLVLLTLDVGVSRELLRLREHQEGLQESVPRLWQRLEELRGKMEQEERDGWQREVAAQRLGAEVGRLHLEGSRFRMEEGAQEAALRAEVAQLGGVTDVPPP